MKPLSSFQQNGQGQSSDKDYVLSSSDDQLSDRDSSSNGYDKKKCKKPKEMIKVVKRKQKPGQYSPQLISLRTLILFSSS